MHWSRPPSRSMTTSIWCAARAAQSSMIGEMNSRPSSSTWKRVMAEAHYTSIEMRPTSSAALPRRAFHRVVFAAAGAYNIRWGLWSAIDPQWLMRFAGMPPANYPAIFACLGMVVGLYGVLYLDVARVPERGWLVAAVGLTGKVLGPIGMVQLIRSGGWPPSAFVLCLTNDVVWWLPFGLYLVDAWPSFRRLELDSGA